MVHVKRLVAAGHKVGVVRQIETAALKKAGDNRNTPFVRKLTNLYTKGTYIDENGTIEQKGDGGKPVGGYLLCLTESNAKRASGTDEKVDVGMIAVHPATGDIIYDSFEDGFMRSEIETRLLHIGPCEFLIVGDITRGTDKLIQHLSGSSTNVFGDRCRVERVSKSTTMAAEAYSHVTKFYSDKLRTNTQSERSVFPPNSSPTDSILKLPASLLDKVMKLPEHVTVCLSAMITHLSDYGLEHIFDLTKYFENFGTRSHMLINGTTLESLEVYRNSTDHSEKGSLFWALDKTQTIMGRRMLRKWVGRPLLDRERLDARSEAVEELVQKKSTGIVIELGTIMKEYVKGDLERSLIRIFYGKCTRHELLVCLQTLRHIAEHYSRRVKKPSDTLFRTPMLINAILVQTQIREMVVSYLDKIDATAAVKDDKYSFFRENEQTEAMVDHQLGIGAVEQELDAHRAVAAAQINKPSPVDYVTVAGIEYLIEIPLNNNKAIPGTWVKISGTRKLARFHTPEVVRLINERDQHREALAAACDAAFADLLKSISENYQPLRDAVNGLATIDCLLSLQKVGILQGYCKPTILPASDTPLISVTKGRHPIAENTIPDGYIPFSTTLAYPSHLALLITGPNMGGKSSFVRAVALLVLLAQIGSYVPADAFSLTLTDAIFTRMGARDNLLAGESTFMVEVSETARILRSATPRSLVILDELGRGTSTHDGAAIAHAVLDYIVRESKCMTLFITHYQNLARVAEGLPGLKNVHMRFSATKAIESGPGTNEEDGDDEEITFLYEVCAGIAHRSYGLNVAKLARIPRKVLDVAAFKSRQLETEMKTRKLRSASIMLHEIMSTASVSQLDNLVGSVDQL